MMKNDIINMLQNNVTVVYGVTNTPINTNNGVLNDRVLRQAKRNFLKNSVADLAEGLIKEKQNYPQNDISDVELTSDFIVMKRKDFDKVFKYIETHE